MADPQSWAIRDGEEGDLPFLRSLYMSTRQDLWLLPAETRLPLVELQFQAQRQAYAAHYPRTRQEIVEVDAAVIGQLLTAEQADELVLVDFSLLPRWRGQGIGSALLQILQTRAQTAGRGIRLQVTRDNPAIRLYSRHGFELSAEDEVRLTLCWRAV